jgi:hypothetical protein
MLEFKIEQVVYFCRHEGKDVFSGKARYVSSDDAMAAEKLSEFGLFIMNSEFQGASIVVDKTYCFIAVPAPPRDDSGYH